MGPKQHLIDWIKAFQQHVKATESRRSFRMGGQMDGVTLTFGYGYFQPGMVYVEIWKPDASDPSGLSPPVLDTSEEMTVEDAVDALFVSQLWYA